MALTEPLRFERRCVPRPWGGRALERVLGFALPRGERIGETWEVVDRARENSRVAGGPHAGRTLGELVREEGRALLGRTRPTSEGRFPLLVKYLDAAEPLSVQVHPDEGAAERIGGGAEPKTEAWYFLGGEPGAEVLAGVAAEIGAERFRAVAGGAGVVETLHRFPARPGECLLVPGGTVHAIGAGALLLEVQQNSDTTYRLYDWGRLGPDGRPRATHVAEAVSAARLGAPRRPPVAPSWERRGGLHRAPLARSRAFAMNALRLDAPARLSTGGQVQLYAVVEGSGALRVRASGAEVPLARGDVWCVPAAAGFHDVAPEPGGLSLVQILERA